MSRFQTHIFFSFIVISAYICVCFVYITKTRRTLFLLKSTTHTIKISPYDSFGRLILMLILSVPLVLRNCGADTSGYFYSYSINRQIGDEPLYYLLQKILYSVFPNARVGFGILSVASIVIVLVAFNMLEDVVDVKYCYLAYFLTQYFCLYNYMRMMFAVSFLILGYAYILKKNKSRAIFAFFLAGGIHFIDGINCIYYYTIFAEIQAICCFLHTRGYWFVFI